MFHCSTRARMAEMLRGGIEFVVVNVIWLRLCSITGLCGSSCPSTIMSFVSSSFGVVVDRGVFITSSIVWIWNVEFDAPKLFVWSHHFLIISSLFLTCCHVIFNHPHNRDFIVDTLKSILMVYPLSIWFEIEYTVHELNCNMNACLSVRCMLTSESG